MVRKAPTTTSGTGSDPNRWRAFTLFEVLIVLAIIALFTGFFMLRFGDGATEESLTKAATDLKGAALKAKRRAYAFRRDQFIVFSPGGFTLTERAPVAEEFAGPPSDESAGGRIYNENFPLPGGVAMDLFPPGATKPVRSPGVVWIFRASGLSDPFGVTFTNDRSFARLRFNVLTALPDVEEIVVE